jgi:hypothetical protein
MGRPDPPDPRHLIEVALRYAEHGWPVLPLHTAHRRGCSCCNAIDCGSPGKHPRTGRGLHDASTDPDQLRGWWTRWPDANVGIATGASSKLLVLDIDLPDGPTSLARLQADQGALPPTCEQRTGSGGRQLLFAHPGHAVGNRTRLLPGIDLRGDGGYIVVPPSIHATGCRYQWLGRIPPADPPGWLLSLLDRSRTPDVPVVDVAARTLPTGSPQQRYIAAALQRELASLATAVEGSRNDTLNRAAFNLGQLAGAGLIGQDQVTAQLEQVAARTGLGSAEIRRTIASGLAAGLQHPRTPPPAIALRPTPDSPSPAMPVRRVEARRR